MSGRYVIRPKADRDLGDEAYYLATQAGAELGHGFCSLRMRRLH